MPNRQIIWLPESLQDLKRLQAFLNKKNPTAANKAAMALKQGAARLLDNPAIGMAVFVGEGDDAELTWFRDLYIPFGSGNHVMRYRLDKDEAGEVIVITRVWHSREEHPY